jgi:hypothetical protein
MASRIESGAEQSMKRGPKLRGWLLAAAGVVLVAVVTAGILYWQTSDDSTTSEPAAVTTASTADVAPVTAREQPAIYIVATQEEADQQMRWLAEADSIRYALGQPPLGSSVFVADTPEKARDFMMLTEAANQDRASEGLPVYRVVDLRR